ncbi:MAG: nucleoside 2-deoxyribosyltransferase [Methanosarcinaceae archaeon]|nr:nucleoside 2-deoxyribosyltransferase [Methanosarcinaceae archaeon]
MKSKKTIYLAGPLFTYAELEFNCKLRTLLESQGFSVFLPQEDAEDAKIEHERKAQAFIFERCVKGVENSDLVVAVLDGTDVDSGTAWEIGYAYAKGKPILGLRTDFRELSNGIVNLMIELAVEGLARDKAEFLSLLKPYR